MVQVMNVPALKKQWVLDAQWTDCPVDVEEVIKNLWRTYELGNDHYMLRISIKDLQEKEDSGYEAEKWFWGEKDEDKKGWITVPSSLMPLIQYIRDAGIPDDEQIIIHWWW